MPGRLVFPSGRPTSRSHPARHRTLFCAPPPALAQPGERVVTGSPAWQTSAPIATRAPRPLPRCRSPLVARAKPPARQRLPTPLSSPRGPLRRRRAGSPISPQPTVWLVYPRRRAFAIAKTLLRTPSSTLCFATPPRLRELNPATLPETRPSVHRAAYALAPPVPSHVPAHRAPRKPARLRPHLSASAGPHRKRLRRSWTDQGVALAVARDADYGGTTGTRCTGSGRRPASPRCNSSRGPS